MSIMSYMPSGLNVNGLIKEYYVYAGGNVNAGNFVDFINGVSGQTTKTATKTTFQSTWSYNLRACEIDTNKALITYEVGFGEASGGLNNPDQYKCRACVATISNDTTITFGQEYEFYDYSAGIRYTSPILINIDTNKALYSYNYEVAEDNIEAYSMVISVSGDTITFGSKTKVSRTWGLYISSCKVDTNKAFIAFQNSYSDNKGGGRVLPISGTTISTGSVTNFTSSLPMYESRCTSHDTNKVVIAFEDGGNNSYGTLVAGTVSGTSVSFGSRVIYESANISTIAAICGIDTNKTIMAYQNSADDLSTIRIITTSGNTITLNDGISFNEGREIGWGIYMKKVDTNKAVILYKDYNTSATSTIMIVSVSGTNISFGTRHNCHSYLNYDNEDSNNGIVLINNNRLLIAYEYGKYFYNNLMFISGTTVSNKLTITNYETQVKKATTNLFDGVAKTSGAGGTSTAHKDKISICVPNI